MSEFQPYQIILADPPWRYSFSKSKSRSIEAKYPTMSTAEICALDVQKIAADDAVLFLWATAPKLPEALKVMEAWGFEYITFDLWVKLPPDKNRDQLIFDESFRPAESRRMGMGFWYRNRHEPILLGRRGKVSPPTTDRRLESVFFDNIGKHSAKPAIARKRIEHMLPDLTPRIELFARDRAAGWDVWGNQLVSDVTLSTRAGK
jgi:N6-adenosine-specific RNA methylase IME4